MPLSAFSVVRVTGQGRRGTVDDQAARGEEETVEHLLNSSHSITSSLIKSRVFGGSRDPATRITAQATRREPAHRRAARCAWALLLARTYEGRWISPFIEVLQKTSAPKVYDFGKRGRRLP